MYIGDGRCVSIYSMIGEYALQKYEQTDAVYTADYSGALLGYRGSNHLSVVDTSGKMYEEKLILDGSRVVDGVAIMDSHVYVISGAFIKQYSMVI